MIPVFLPNIWINDTVKFKAAFLWEVRGHAWLKYKFSRTLCKLSACFCVSNVKAAFFHSRKEKAANMSQ